MPRPCIVKGSVVKGIQNTFRRRTRHCSSDELNNIVIQFVLLTKENFFEHFYIFVLFINILKSSNTDTGE